MATNLELRLVRMAFEGIDSYDVQSIITEMLENVLENGEQEWDLDTFLEKIGEIA